MTQESTLIWKYDDYESTLLVTQLKKPNDDYETTLLATQSKKLNDDYETTFPTHVEKCLHCTHDLPAHDEVRVVVVRRVKFFKTHSERRKNRETNHSIQFLLARET